MSEVTKTKTVKREQVVALKCDMCGKTTNRDKGVRNWTNKKWRVEKVDTLHIQEGERYPEASKGDEVNVDLCPDCFRNKLIPWLEQNGVEIEWEKYDYIFG